MTYEQRQGTPTWREEERPLPPGPRAAPVPPPSVIDHKTLAEWLVRGHASALGAISGAVAGLGTDDGALRHVRTIEASVARAAALVKQVLGFARGMGGTKVPIAARHVMRDVAAMLDATLFKDVNVHMNTARELPLVLADPMQLHQVLLSLAVNAAQAT